MTDQELLDAETEAHALMAAAARLEQLEAELVRLRTALQACAAQECESLAWSNNDCPAEDPCASCLARAALRI